MAEALPVRVQPGDIVYGGSEYRLYLSAGAHMVANEQEVTGIVPNIPVISALGQAVRAELVRRERDPQGRVAGSLHRIVVRTTQNNGRRTLTNPVGWDTRLSTAGPDAPYHLYYSDGSVQPPQVVTRRQLVAEAQASGHRVVHEVSIAGFGLTQIAEHAQQVAGSFLTGVHDVTPQGDLRIQDSWARHIDDLMSGLMRSPDFDEAAYMRVGETWRWVMPFIIQPMPAGADEALAIER